MSVTIANTSDELDQFLKEHLERPIPEADQKICTETIREFSQKLKADLGIVEGPVVIAGHQPIFYHPGILAKDILVQSIVSRHGGTALSLILDTDQESIDFSWPGAGKQSVALSDANRIVAGQALSRRRHRQLLDAVEQSLVDLSVALTPEAADRARPYLLHLRGVVRQTNDLITITNSVREFHAKKFNWKIRYIRASDLVKTKAFQFFAAEIFARSAQFRDEFNQTLAQYRLDHNISNHAQPFPDLKEDELPFWFTLHGSRRPLTDTDTAKAGFVPGKDHPAAFSKLFEEGHILPRAITLSLFLRLFLCDLFVHGTGGGRYDQITEVMIKLFFSCHAAPMTVATATLKLNARADIALPSATDRSAVDLHDDERRLEFDPVRFLPNECQLHQQKKVLILLRSGLQGAKRKLSLDKRVTNNIKELLEKTPVSFQNRINSLTERLTDPGQNPPRLIHQEFVKLRRLAQPYIEGRKKQVAAEIERNRLCQSNNRLYADRSFPFFFYDLTELDTAFRLYSKTADIEGRLAEQSA